MKDAVATPLGKKAKKAQRKEIKKVTVDYLYLNHHYPKLASFL